MNEYLSSITAYVLRWYVPIPVFTRAHKADMMKYAAEVGENSMLDQLNAAITYARANPNRYAFRPNTVEVKAADKAKMALQMLASTGVDIETYMPYRIAYVGEHSRATAEMLGERLHATHVCAIEDAAPNSVEIVVAISTMHQRGNRHLSKMTSKLVEGGFFIIRENDVHCNRRDVGTRNYIATEFLDVMNVAMEIIDRVYSIEVPAAATTHEDDCTMTVRAADGRVVARVPPQYYSVMGGILRVQFDYKHGDDIVRDVEGAVRVDWEKCKKSLIDSGALRANSYKNRKAWDRAFVNNGFETFRPITYRSANPHKVYHMIYRKC